MRGRAGKGVDGRKRPAEAQSSAFDPFEIWATKDFRSAKACSSRFAKRDIVLSICWV